MLVYQRVNPTDPASRHPDPAPSYHSPTPPRRRPWTPWPAAAGGGGPRRSCRGPAPETGPRCAAWRGSRNMVHQNRWEIPSGKLTLLWKITVFNGKIHYKWSFSIAMLIYQRVYGTYIWDIYICICMYIYNV